MPKLRPTPDSVIDAGTALVRARRTAWQLESDIAAALEAVEAATQEMVRAGAKEMQAGAARARLYQAAMAYGLIGEAHDSLRAVIGQLGYSEPENDKILARLAKPTIQPKGGGGGGGRGR